LVLKLSTALQNQFINKILFVDNKGGTSDFWMLADDDEIPVILANHYSGGVNWKGNLWSIDIELYTSQFTGVTAYQIPAVYLSYSPSVYYKGKSNSTGIDIFIQNSGKISNTSIGYSYAFSKQNFDNIVEGEAFPTVNDQTHEVKIIQNLKLKKWEFVASWVYGSGKPYTMPMGFYSIDLIDGTNRIEIDESNKNNRRLPAYHRLDLAVNYFLNYRKVKINFGLSVINVYNHKNVKNIKFDVLNNNNTEITDYILTSSSEMALGFTPSLYIKINYNR
jgi:ferric enterobactin receptor